MMATKINKAAIQEIIAALLARGPAFAGDNMARTASLAREWDECGFTPIEARNWMNAGYWNPSAAADAFAAGHSSHDRPRYVEGQRQSAGMAPISALCNDDVLVSDLLWD